MALPISPDRAGHIVAVEGPADLVSTQLRLLPASRQILVLPSLQHYLRDSDPDAPFDSRELILRYRAAAQTRHSEALEFLQPSVSRDEKRLVLMHGGTMSAHVSCLSTIMEHDTDCDIEKAQATFIRLASNGVAGLSARSSYHQTGPLPSKDAEEHEGSKPPASNEGKNLSNARAEYLDAAGDDTFEDRIIRAMKAADALDKETEFLQPVTPTVDLTSKLVDIPSRSKKRLSSMVADGPETIRNSKPPSPHDDQASLPAEPASRVSHPTNSAEEPAPTAPRKPPLRIRIPSSPIPWAGDVVAGRNRHSPTVFEGQGLAQDWRRHRRSRTAESNLSPRQISTSHGNAHSRLGVRRTASEGQQLSQKAAENLAHSDALQLTAAEEQSFGPVLPLLEDLVVYLTPQTPDQLQNFVFRRLSESCRTPRASLPGPDMAHNPFQGASHLVLGDDQETDQAESEDEHSNSVMPWTRKDLVHGLPTPNHSPNPSETASMAMPQQDTRFYSISVEQETAVSIQNFLRSFLASQFPLQDRRLSAADGSGFTPDTGLWRTLECDAQVVSSSGESRLDLILAVGAESSVTKNRLSEVVGQIEKLGFKANGSSRSGRLDIRYLIVNAMQAFTAQPLTKQTQSNPFANRALLAALIIPHLETYLAAHPDVRFLLIEYPSEHLPTILALQTLIGTDMMKVVGIIDSDVSSPMQPLPTPDTDRRPSEGFRSLNRRGSRLSGAFVGPCSFSKANFLLASSATGFETAALVAAIRESLISISDYYMPERPLYKHPTPPTPPRKAYPKLTVDTKAANAVSAPPQKEPAAVSVSTLVITPPSSPTESSLPPTQARPKTPPPPAHHVNPRSIPPRSSSTSAPTFPPKETGTARPRTSSTATSHIRWGEVNYAAVSSTPCSSPPSSSAAAHTVPRTSSNATTLVGGTSVSSESSFPHKIHRHRHKDSDPLSPRGVGPSAAETAFCGGDDLIGGEREEEDDEYGFEDEDDEVQDDPEMRRLMPLFLRTREEVERGRSSKAMRWLGLV